LLDTNVLSELRKRDRADPGVRHWFGATPDEDLLLSVLVLGELRQGVERVRRRDAKTARHLEQWLRHLATAFADRLIAVDAAVADQWGALNARDPLPVVDGLLAATAMVHGLAVVTRNTADFARTGAQVLNPFAH
jgi:predicted nucleic acid-binding protein